MNFGKSEDWRSSTPPRIITRQIFPEARFQAKSKLKVCLIERGDIANSYLLSKSLSGDDADKGQLKSGVYAAQAGRGNLIIGSTRQFAGYDCSTSYPGAQTLLRQTAALIPILSKLHVLRFYAGLRPTSPDGLPILGRAPELPGFILATGHEGDGIALLPITGKHIADLITGRIAKAELAPFSPQRFSYAERSVEMPH